MEKKQNETKEAVNPKRKKPTAIPEGTLIKVKSGFHGKLYYKNLVTQERVVWENFGETQVMTLRELRAMRTTQPAFFKNQWLIIVGVADGEDCEATPYEICKCLVVTEYYKDFIDPDDFDLVCEWDENEIKCRIEMMAPGVRENLIIALNEYISSGRLDSIKKIKAFEKALDCELRYHD